MAVLNGPVARAWHRLSFRDARQRAFPQVKVSHLRTQPFPIAERAEAPRLHDEVAAEVRAQIGAGEVDPDRVARIEARVIDAYGLAAPVIARLRAAAARVPSRERAER